MFVRVQNPLGLEDKQSFIKSSPEHLVAPSDLTIAGLEQLGMNLPSFHLQSSMSGKATIEHGNVSNNVSSFNRSIDQSLPMVLLNSGECFEFSFLGLLCRVSEGAAVC